MNLQQDFIGKRILINTLVNGLTKLIVIIMGIILTPLLLLGLGKYEYGLWLLVGQITSLLLMADMGIANSIGRLISKYDAVSSIEGKNSIYSSALTIFFVVTPVIVLIALMFIPAVPKLLSVQTEYAHIVEHVLYITIVNFVFIFPLRVGRGLMQSKSRYDVIDVVIALSKVLQVIIIVFLLYMNTMTLIILAWLMAFTNILSELIIFIKAKQAHKDIKFSASFLKRDSFAELFSMGGASILLSVSSAMLQPAMVFLIGGVLGILFIPIFSIPFMLLSIIGTSIGRIGITLMPIVSAYNSLSEVKKILNLSVYALRYTSMFGLLVSVYIYLYGQQLLVLWLPPEQITINDIDVMYKLLLLLTIPFILARSNQGNRAILLSTGSHWLVSIMLLISTIVGFICALFLVNFTNLGIYSIAIGWVVKILFGDYFFTLYFFIAKYKVDIKKYMITAYAKNIMIIIPVIIVGKTTVAFIGNDTLLKLIMGTSLFFVFSFTLFYFFCLEKRHKAMFTPACIKNLLKL